MTAATRRRARIAAFYRCRSEQAGVRCTLAAGHQARRGTPHDFGEIVVHDTWDYTYEKLNPRHLQGTIVGAHCVCGEPLDWKAVPQDRTLSDYAHAFQAHAAHVDAVTPYYGPEPKGYWVAVVSALDETDATCPHCGEEDGLRLVEEHSAWNGGDVFVCQWCDIRTTSTDLVEYRKEARAAEEAPST